MRPPRVKRRVGGGRRGSGGVPFLLQCVRTIIVTALRTFRPSTLRSLTVSARSTDALCVNTTTPKPRERRVEGSFITTASCTSPNCAKNVLRDAEEETPYTNNTRQNSTQASRKRTQHIKDAAGACRACSHWNSRATKVDKTRNMKALPSVVENERPPTKIFLENA